MARNEALRITEKLLLAAFDLEQRGHSPFSAEDLVVSAWQKFPDAFGLAGHRGDDGQLCYPDSNRVFAEIMGSKPIRKRGLLRKVATKMYQLTEGGREHARLLLRRTGESRVEKAGLSREIEQQLKSSVIDGLMISLFMMRVLFGGFHQEARRLSLRGGLPT